MRIDATFKETEIGPIPEEWEVSRLGDFFPIKTGKRDANFSVLNGKYPFFTCAQNVLRCNEYSFEGDALLLSGNGDFNMKKYSGKFDAYQRTYVLIPYDSDERDFLYYAMKYHLPHITEGSRGSVISFLTKGMIEDFHFGCPTNKAERKKIAEILSSLDRKIELNRKMNKTLEEIAQALFKRWFVDFEFPADSASSDQAGELIEPGKPYKSSGGKMIDSELGEIPEGWRVGLLSDLVENIVDRYSGDNYVDNLPYVPIDSISGKSLGLVSVADSKDAKSSLVRFKKDDILFGAMRPYFHKVSVAPFEGLTRTTCFVLRPKNAFSRIYSTLLIFQKSTIDFTTANSEGSTIPYAKWNNSMSKMPILIPNSETLKKFNSITCLLIGKIRDSYFENSELLETRESLLPRLMSGKIRVDKR